jgi:hypothetical protein
MNGNDTVCYALVYSPLGREPKGGRQAAGGKPASSQRAQASSLKQKPGKQRAPPHAGENHYRVGGRESKCTV